MGMELELASGELIRSEQSRSHWNPLRVTGADLPPNLLLMAKILALCFFLSGAWANLPDHFLPFLQIFDHAGPPAVFHRTLQIFFLAAATALFLNYRARAACLVLGGLVLIGILSSRPYFQNNLTFTGCLWFVAGLHTPGQKPWVVRYQVILPVFWCWSEQAAGFRLAQWAILREYGGASRQSSGILRFC